MDLGALKQTTGNDWRTTKSILGRKLGNFAEKIYGHSNKMDNSVFREFRDQDMIDNME